jgi:hypothetical protein
MNKKLPGTIFKLQGWENQLINRTPGIINKIHELSIVCPGLQFPGKQAESRILKSGSH